MRSVGSIRHRAQQVRFRALKKHLELLLNTSPLTCAHHGWSHVQGSNPVGLCFHSSGVSKKVLPSDPTSFLRPVVEVCDVRLTPSKALSCPYYEGTLTKSQAKDLFTKVFSQGESEVRRRFPEYAALLWVLGDEYESTSTSDDVLPGDRRHLNPVQTQRLYLSENGNGYGYRPKPSSWLNVDLRSEPYWIFPPSRVHD